MERGARLGDHEGVLKFTFPARICLFGDHQDYLGLPVIACAIDRFIQLEALPMDTQEFLIRLPDIGQVRRIELADAFEVLEARDYFGSAIKVLRRKGLVFDQGYDLRITGDIPINSGLSSSTALSLAWMRFLTETFSKHDYSSEELARLCYEAEVLEHGEPGGMMDQFSIAHQGVIHLTTVEPYKVTPIDVSIPGLVIGDSGIEKKTIDVLQQARDGQLKAIETALAKSDRMEAAELTADDLDDLLPHVAEYLQPYLRAAVFNHIITCSAYQELKSSEPDWKEIGSLMNRHQDHLRDDLRVSISELDNIIAAALNAGALGAKLVGSGGGGCIVALAPGKEEEVRKALLSAGAQDAFRVNVVQLANLDS